MNSIVPVLAGEARQADPYVIRKRDPLVLRLTPGDLPVRHAVGEQRGAAVELPDLQDDAGLAQGLEQARGVRILRWCGVPVGGVQLRDPIWLVLLRLRLVTARQ